MDESDIACYIYGYRFSPATSYGGAFMENRSIEIAQRKARHRSGKSFHVKSGPPGHLRGGSGPMFFGPPDPPVSGIRFPPDIRPERRAAATSTIAFVLAAPPPVIEAPPQKARAPEKGEPPRKAKAPPKRKATARTKKLRTKAKAPKIAAPPPKSKSGTRPKTKTPAIQAAPAPPAPVTPVPDLEPPFIPPERTPASPMADTTPHSRATPVPRARAIAVYRKNGLLDLIGYWLRSGWSGVTAHFRRPRKPDVPSAAQLLAENDALRRELARLRSEKG